MDAGEHDRTQDPGWRAAWRGAQWLVTPTTAHELRRRGDELLLLRAAFVAFVVAVVAVALPVTILVFTVHFELTDLSAASVTAMVAVTGLWALAVVSRLPPLRCADDEALAASYRTTFFRRTAVAELSTVLGYVGAILTAHIGPYVVGAAFSLASLSRIAPTASKLARDQQALTAAGCPRSLIGALRRNANRPPQWDGRSGGGGGI